MYLRYKSVTYMFFVTNGTVYMMNRALNLCTRRSVENIYINEF